MQRFLQKSKITHQRAGDSDGDHCEPGEGGGEGAQALLVGPLAEPAEELLAGEDDVAAVDARVGVLDVHDDEAERLEDLSHAAGLPLPAGDAGVGDEGVVAHDDGGVLGEDAVGVLLVGREGGHAEPGGPQGVDVGPVLLAGLGQVDLFERKVSGNCGKFKLGI